MHVFGSQTITAVNVVEVARALADSSDLEFTYMGDSLPFTPINRRAKFDAASIFLGGEIRNRTKNKRTDKQ